MAQPRWLRKAWADGDARLAGAELSRILRKIDPKTMASILFNVSPYDPLVFLAVPAVIAFFALPAILSPAVRATRVDPSSLFRVN